MNNQDDHPDLQDGHSSGMYLFMSMPCPRPCSVSSQPVLSLFVVILICRMKNAVLGCPSWLSCIIVMPALKVAQTLTQRIDQAVIKFLIAAVPGKPIASPVGHAVNKHLCPGAVCECPG